MPPSRSVVVLGGGKTGGIVAQVARERGHAVRIVEADENANAAWITSDNLRDYDVLIDFTTPEAVLANVEAALRAGRPIVVGTTGWYSRLEQIRQAAQSSSTAVMFGANFSYGVNLFFQIVRAASPALTHGYAGHITERHHILKKDAPSGTAITMQRVLAESTGNTVEISSEREGEITGTHTLELDSAGDRIVLMHDAKSRRTFAEGAVLAAEWIIGKQGFFDFKDIFTQL